MKLIYTGKNYKVSETLKEVAGKKIGKLSKYFDEELEARVVFSEERNFKIVEVTVYLPGGLLRAEEEDMEMYTAIDRAVDALESQIRKHKTKLQKRYRTNETIRFDNIDTSEVEKEEEGPKIVRIKRFGLKPMLAEEAVLQMDLLGHNFFVFLEGETNTVQVVYKRKDGNYGLITPELDD